MLYGTVCGSKMEDNQSFCASCSEQLQPEGVPAANRRAPARNPRWIYRLVGLMVIALIIGGVAMGCLDGIQEDGIYGMWVAENIPENRLEIKRDGTFAMLAGPVPIHTGTWEMVGNEISFEVMGIVFMEGRVEGNRIIALMGGPLAPVEIVYARR